ncbi:hypothetical protein R1flu_012131 [Riccia fluitans]|uniref:Uncharacterized protein n=1 Tax=Riccia fluitans TaxID=41844 RepID=A0ABD1ZAX4_9MARC
MLEVADNLVAARSKTRNGGHHSCPDSTYYSMKSKKSSGCCPRLHRHALTIGHRDDNSFQLKIESSIDARNKRLSAESSCLCRRSTAFSPIGRETGSSGAHVKKEKSGMMLMSGNSDINVRPKILAATALRGLQAFRG